VRGARVCILPASDFQVSWVSSSLLLQANTRAFASVLAGWGHRVVAVRQASS
jgi:hypothetical protein